MYFPIIKRQMNLNLYRKRQLVSDCVDILSDYENIIAVYSSNYLQ